MGVVYKQRYKSVREKDTVMLNGKHLAYIASRKGVIPNEGCGFGLWGNSAEDGTPHDINNLTKAISEIRSVSKTHTVYRGIISLDEETALIKGLGEREEWERLVNLHISAIAEENEIELKNFRYFASFHQEKGHPHVHIVFWDSSEAVRSEYMPKERFEIAMEKIRASFNKTVFAAELAEIRDEQTAAKKDLRALSRNFLDDKTSFLDNNESADSADTPARFYPKSLSKQDIEEIYNQLEELLPLLPKKGQLKYKFLAPDIKSVLDSLSEKVIAVTTLQKPYLDYLDAVKRIAQTYGNDDEAVERQLEKAKRDILHDVGNDLLSAIKGLHSPGKVLQGFLRSNAEPEQISGLAEEVRQEMEKAIADVTGAKLADPEFTAKIAELSEMFPPLLTPKYEVLADEKTAAALRSLTIDCMSELDEAVKRASVFTKAAAPEGEPTGNTYKEVYGRIHTMIYDTAAAERGYPEMERACGAMQLLTAFCRLNNSGRSGNLQSKTAALKSLSKQAKKDRALAQKDSAGAWETEMFF